jgi:hypothetical protein
VEDSSDSDSDIMPQPRYIYGGGVAGPLGQLRGVEDSSDSDSDLMPQPRYIYGGRCGWSFGAADSRR